MDCRDVAVLAAEKFGFTGVYGKPPPVPATDGGIVYEGETGLKLFKKTCWLIGFLPAVIGGSLIWHIWDNMRMTSMLTDILAITAVGILAAGLTVSAVAALLVVSRYLCEKDRGPRPPDQS